MLLCQGNDPFTHSPTQYIPSYRRVHPFIKGYHEWVKLGVGTSLGTDFASEPETSDDHFKLFGMRAEDFKTTDETCPTCENRMDELGWCGHGNIGGD